MNRVRHTLALFGLFAVTASMPGQITSSRPDEKSKERAHIVLSTSLPELDGGHLKATLVEVNYGPGEASSPHTHPCAVIGYVVAGAVRTQVQGEPEKIVPAGGSFYEPRNGAHLISANASSTEPAKLLAYQICDKDAPISVPLDPAIHQNGAKK